MTQTGTAAPAAPARTIDHDAITRMLDSLNARDAQVDYRVAVTPVSHATTISDRARLDAQAARLFSVLGF